MADNTRVKKLARKLQAETGMRYTEALARVRLQGAAAPEKNMTPTMVDTLDLGTQTLASGGHHTFTARLERVGRIRGLNIQAQDLSVLLAESYVAGGIPISTGPCPASMLMGPLRAGIMLNPDQLVQVALVNHGEQEQVVRVTADFEDHTAETLKDFGTLFEKPRMVENRFNGLGSTILKASGSDELRDVCQRNVRVTRLWLTVPEGLEDQVRVDSIICAGLPVDLGDSNDTIKGLLKRAPLAGTIILSGQSIAVRLTNLTGHETIVAGGLEVEELNPYLVQQHWQDTLVQAATRSPKRPPANPQVGQAEPWQAAQAGHIEVAVRPVDGHHLECLELTVVGSTAPEGLLLNGVKLPCDWSESDEVDGGWDTIVHFKDGRVFGPGPDRVVGTKWRASGLPVPVFDEATSTVIVQGEGVAAAKVFTAWRPVITP